ncbi:hypothetical protein CRM22_005320 [Opisthorchis felineus]|uniref:Uncharacterized protein n=1 Tax=Opisthorchis felineus TaxID=147828 RepID=A0A4S2LRL5_OPIFE|nr:hypothetical protein CRM22_005320 [Opisthorchis felineus]
MSNCPYDHHVQKSKCVFLGEQNVGKTCIILRFMHDVFDQTYQATIGIDFLSKTLCLDQKSVRLQLWDTAGQERFRSLIPNYIRDSAVSIVVYDVTSRDSFDRTVEWIRKIRDERDTSSLIFLVGNKVDLEDERVITTEEGTELAKKEGLFFLETSAKSNIGIQKLFKWIGREIIKTGRYTGPPSSRTSLVEPEPEKKRRWRCWCW